MTEVRERKNVRWVLLDLENEIAHGMCVSNLAYRVSRELALPQEEVKEMALAGFLHDVGKLELAKYIYARAEKTLAVEEMKYVRTHSTLSFAILNKEGYSRRILDSILYHHENYDGTGYPSNMVGTDIPLGARILRVCDVFAALTTDRPYRKSFDMDVAVELMIEEVKNFDMEVFLAFLRVIHEEGIEEILDRENIELKIEEDLL